MRGSKGSATNTYAAVGFKHQEVCVAEELADHGVGRLKVARSPCSLGIGCTTQPTRVEDVQAPLAVIDVLNSHAWRLDSQGDSSSGKNA